MAPISKIIIHDTKTNTIHKILSQNGWLFKYLIPTKHSRSQTTTNIYIPTKEFNQYPQLLDRLRIWTNEQTPAVQIEINYEDD